MCITSCLLLAALFDGRPPTVASALDNLHDMRPLLGSPPIQKKVPPIKLGNGMLKSLFWFFENHVL